MSDASKLLVRGPGVPCAFRLTVNLCLAFAVLSGCSTSATLLLVDGTLLEGGTIEGGDEDALLYEFGSGGTQRVPGRAAGPEVEVAPPSRLEGTMGLGDLGGSRQSRRQEQRDPRSSGSPHETAYESTERTGLVEVPRSDIAAIDHPGDSAVIFGAILILAAVVMLGLSQDCSDTSITASCQTLPVLGGALLVLPGLGLMTWGADVGSSSRSRAAPPGESSPGEAVTHFSEGGVHLGLTFTW
jgi:hypothetical protein